MFYIYHIETYRRSTLVNYIDNNFEVWLFCLSIFFWCLLFYLSVEILKYDCFQSIPKDESVICLNQKWVQNIFFSEAVGTKAKVIINNTCFWNLSLTSLLYEILNPRTDIDFKLWWNRYCWSCLHVDTRTGTLQLNFIIHFNNHWCLLPGTCQT